MRHIDGVKVRPSQSGGLRARRAHKLVGRHGYRGNIPILQPDCVVQTARCARSSIGQSLDHGIGAAQLLQQMLGGWFSEGRLDLTDHARNGLALHQ